MTLATWILALLFGLYVVAVLILVLLFLPDRPREAKRLRMGLRFLKKGGKNNGSPIS